MKILIKLQQNFSKIHVASFKTLLHYENYSVGLLESPEYKIALKTLQQLVLMPTTYMSEKGFSSLVEIKTKKQNALTGMDFLMRGTLEKLIHQQFEKLITGTSQSLVNTEQLFVVVVNGAF